MMPVRYLSTHNPIVPSAPFPEFPVEYPPDQYIAQDAPPYHYPPGDTRFGEVEHFDMAPQMPPGHHHQHHPTGEFAEEGGYYDPKYFSEPLPYPAQDIHSPVQQHMHPHPHPVPTPPPQDVVEQSAEEVEKDVGKEEEESNGPPVSRYQSISKRTGKSFAGTRRRESGRASRHT
jgi:hypothetical protein